MITRRKFLAHSLGISAASVMMLKLQAKETHDYQLIAKPSKASLLEDANIKTDVWAYNDLVPGPVIRAKKGKEISIEFVNQLDQPTSVHWHGIRIDNAMDGVSNLTQAPVQPGESFVYRFTPPDAGTYWYHPHNRTWEQLARGLYGTLIVEGDETEEVDQDLNIVVDDWRLEENGLLHEASFGAMRDWTHGGRLGNILTLNGKPYERLDVLVGERIRLRFINTANARIMRFAISEHDNWLVALDGQPVTPTLLGKDGVTLSPAQRADIIIDVKGESGDEIAILETSSEEGLIAGYLVCGQGEVSRSAKSGKPLSLSGNNIPQPDLHNAKEFELVMSGGAMRFLSSGIFKGEKLSGRELAMKHGQVWSFNGVSGMSETPYFKADIGDTIKVKIINDTLWPHAIHFHGHHFKTQARGRLGDGSTILMPDYEINSLRDTILIERDEFVEITFVADNPGKWMMHCHMLEHQAAGMATWFEVA